MKLFGLNIQVSRSDPTTPQVLPVSKAFYSPQEWLRGQDVGGGTQLSNAYEQVVWVYRAINVLAEQVANVPFVLPPARCSIFTPVRTR